MERIQILLAVGTGDVCVGFRMLINAQKDFAIVGEIADGKDAFERIRETRPDVAIIDNGLPHVDMIDLLARLTTLKGMTKLLLLVQRDPGSGFHRLLKKGACGYLLKATSSHELVKAIRIVAAGGRFLGDHALDGDVVETQTAEPTTIESSTPLLSHREEEVIRQIAHGYANKEIASKLGISIKTVETYKSRATAKLGLRGRADIVRYALSHDWLRHES